MPLGRMRAHLPRLLCSAVRPHAAREVDGQGNLIFNGIRVRMGIHTGYVNSKRNPVTGVGAPLRLLLLLPC